MLEGVIVKGIGGFYYVKTDEGLIECRARGVFREEKITPLVGDKVKIKISEEDGSGYVVDIKERKTQLLRPPVANVTQAILVMSVKNPDINSWLLDKFLLMSEYQGLEVIVCINKYDLDPSLSEKYQEIYNKAGYNALLTSCKLDVGIDKLRKLLDNNISVFAGPSGAGKSSLLNKVDGRLNLETGTVSYKTKRGKHTTRHSELLELNDRSYILDTPGFSSLDLDFIEQENHVKEYFREIRKFGAECRFLTCLHDKEPNCAVKEKAQEGIINEERYKNYLLLLNEVRNIRRY
ncbi:MAG TPA: ribosome small subunit-dependent GTPase A [Tissierellaceae bacterium]|nr:ribosome small subunit-dependent GTPase A [Tissierellaceae bacterium]